MTSSIKLLLPAMGAMFLSACASPFLGSGANSQEIFDKNGQLAYLVSCKSAQWGACIARAGEICRDAGYSIMEQNNRWTSDGDTREMVFACKGKPSNAEGKP